ncbi:MAG TPA: tyrosine-protein phosphatase [Actinomycetota bacterium]|nr:tyrosine-protein phosphatase [Actinomycetota bacterium]
MSSSVGTRRIEFEGSFNFRDLGGWRTNDGRTVRWRRLYRADSVHRLTAADAGRVHEELGIRTLMDLRNDLEVGAYGIGLLAEGGMMRHHLPITSRPREAPVVGGAAAVPNPDRTPEEMLAVYLGMLEVSSDLVVGGVEAIATDDALPAVFFCAAGKDRTGVLSAVVLGALGVRDEDLIEDYFLTRDAIEQIIERIASDPDSPDMYRDNPPMHFAPYEETMQRFVDEVRDRYGSFAGYLVAKGLPEPTLERLRSALIE